MIDEKELIGWLNDRIKDESSALELLAMHPLASACASGARDAYLNVMKYLTWEEDD